MSKDYREQLDEENIYSSFEEALIAEDENEMAAIITDAITHERYDLADKMQQELDAYKKKEEKWILQEQV